LSKEALGIGAAVFDRNGLPAWIADVLLGNDFGRDFLAPGQDGVVDLAGDVSLDAPPRILPM
jgi:hypothetical protein